MEYTNKHKKILIITAVILVVVLCALPMILKGRRNTLPSHPYVTTAPTDSENVQKDPSGSSELPQESQTVPTETSIPSVIETLPPAQWETVPDLGVSYEQWLCAAQLMAVSIYYPDFQLEGMYTASATALGESKNSSGAYICFTSGGEEYLIRSLPLSGLRSEAGTTDLETAQLGYATFDRLDPGSVDLSAMEKQDLEELGQLVDFSMLVTLYSN